MRGTFVLLVLGDGVRTEFYLIVCLRNSESIHSYDGSV
jgi:hypothetical protein